MKKNITLYSIKAIACFFVICLHTSFPGKTGSTIIDIARFAVPAFFMISGYFSFYKDKKQMSEKINGRIKKILILTLISFIVYFALNIIINIRYDNMGNYIEGLLNYKNIIKFVVLNWTTPIVGVGHLWYLFALLYIYIILKLVNKYNLYKFAYIYSFIVIPLIYIFEIYNSSNNLFISQIYYRNAWFMGFAFFMLGHFIRYFENKLKMSDRKLIILSIVSIVLMSIIYYYENRFMNNDNCLFVSNILLDLLLFIIAINKPNIDILSNLGKNDSSNIYIIHYAVIIIIKCYLIRYFNSFYINHLPIVVFIISYILSIIYRFIKSKIFIGGKHGKTFVKRITK